MVVRYDSPWRRRSVMIGAALCATILLYGIYEWGRFQGGYSKFAEVQRRRELASKIEALEDTNAKLRSEVAAAWLARDVDK
jgi:predicted oxidoreductase